MSTQWLWDGGSHLVRHLTSSYIEKLTRPKRGSWGELAALVGPGCQWSVARFMIATSSRLYVTLEQVSTLCPRPHSRNPVILLSPTMMCVQLADSTIRYHEGFVHNLLVQVKDTFIITDFMVLHMEGDLGISLILRWPFLRVARAMIDVGTRKISLLIMGKNMKFRFQNKR